MRKYLFYIIYDMINFVLFNKSVDLSAFIYSFSVMEYYNTIIGHFSEKLLHQYIPKNC